MIVSNTFGEQFTFDMTGNWLNYKQDANGDGTFEVNQTRTHNTTNEIQTISGGNTLVSHDRNGCMTKFPKPWNGTDAYTCVYDAWNRLAQVKDDTTVVATYVYDTRNHRIKKTVGTVVTLSYFNQNWQEIESIAAGVTTTNVYGLRYIDDVVRRIKGDEVLYPLQDPNWNVCALVTPSGVVAERITYDSFGKPTFRNANFTAKTASSYGWSKTFTGQVYDVETGLILYRNRYYHTGLGRFITRDPINYRGEDSNLYRYVQNTIPNHVDAEGFQGDGINLHASPMPGTGVIYGRGIGTPIEPSKYPNYWNRDGSVLDVDRFCSFVTQSKACGNNGCTKDMCISNINQLIQIAKDTHSSTWLNQCQSWGNNFWENTKGKEETSFYGPQACFSMSTSWYNDMRWKEISFLDSMLEGRIVHGGHYMIAIEMCNGATFMIDNGWIHGKFNLLFGDYHIFPQEMIPSFYIKGSP